jgi:hypothetical protein
VDAIADIRYACQKSPPFALDVFSGPAGAENELHPSAEALRAFLISIGPGLLPARGWRLAERTETIAFYIAEGVAEAPYAQVQLEMSGAWTVTRYGDCRPQLSHPGIGGSELMLDAGDPPPDAATTELFVLVIELDCASGRSAADRLLPPVVELTPAQARIAIPVRQIDGPRECSPNPQTRSKILLGEPLGERELVNASVLPYSPIVP